MTISNEGKRAEVEHILQSYRQIIIDDYLQAALDTTRIGRRHYLSDVFSIDDFNIYDEDFTREVSEISQFIRANACDIYDYLTYVSLRPSWPPIGADIWHDRNRLTRGFYDRGKAPAFCNLNTAARELGKSQVYLNPYRLDDDEPQLTFWR